MPGQAACLPTVCSENGRFQGHLVEVPLQELERSHAQCMHMLMPQSCHVIACISLHGYRLDTAEATILVHMDRGSLLHIYMDRLWQMMSLVRLSKGKLLC